MFRVSPISRTLGRIRNRPSGDWNGRVERVTRGYNSAEVIFVSERRQRSPIDVDWSRLVTDREWAFYEPVLQEAEQLALPFAIGGGIAFSLYSGRWRNTRDIDLFVRPHDRQAFIDLITRHGFEDYFDRDSYDRSWIYRGYQHGAIIDIIWEMANHRALVDDDWIEGGAAFVANGIPLRLIPPEQLIFAKLYVMQRERCDWPDLLSVLNTQAHQLDWNHLIDIVGDDRSLLCGLLCTFGWLCPDTARQTPAEVWQRLGLAEVPWSSNGTTLGRRRIDLLDSRDWFGPNNADDAQEPSC